MQFLTGARRAPGRIAAVVVMLVAAIALAPDASAATAPAYEQRTGATPASLVHVAGWSAGPVARWTGYHRQGGSRRVREVQRRLRRLGYAPGPVDGRFGPRTERATLRFQLRNALRVDGVVGPETLSSLRAQTGRRPVRARWSAGPVDRGAGYATPGGSVRVRELQSALRSLGLSPGPVDGRFGPRTAVALRRFQARRGLRADGVAATATVLALRRVVRAGSPTRTAEPQRPAPEHPARRLVHSAAPPPHRAPAAHPPPSLSTALVEVALVLLGLSTVAIAYLRTRHRIRLALTAAHREEPR
ncbi:MAG TPA: peptidoglycan-binding protein [Baekduia sp.]|nr:peptidoglycan-binding protein [Baekduia sp.]